MSLPRVCTRANRSSHSATVRGLTAAALIDILANFSSSKWFCCEVGSPVSSPHHDVRTSVLIAGPPAGPPWSSCSRCSTETNCAAAKNAFLDGNSRGGNTDGILDVRCVHFGKDFGRNLRRSRWRRREEKSNWTTGPGRPNFRNSRSECYICWIDRRAPYESPDFS